MLQEGAAFVLFPLVGSNKGCLFAFTDAPKGTGSGFTMIPTEPFGDEFIFDQPIVSFADGRKLVCHQACACVTAEQDEEAALTAAWEVVRELALWLAEKFKSLPEDESFQIIVAWSLRVRPHQGHIFKIRGFRDLLQQIIMCETYQKYAQSTGDKWVPMPGWQRDVFARGQA